MSRWAQESAFPTDSWILLSDADAADLETTFENH